MSKINQSSVISASRFLPAIRARLTNLTSRVVERWRHSQTIATLSRLDARQLEDIGMSRNDILHVSAGHLSSGSDRIRDPWRCFCDVVPRGRGFQ